MSYAKQQVLLSLLVVTFCVIMGISSVSIPILGGIISLMVLQGVFLLSIPRVGEKNENNGGTLILLLVLGLTCLALKWGLIFMLTLA